VTSDLICNVHRTDTVHILPLSSHLPNAPTNISVYLLRCNMHMNSICVSFQPHLSIFNTETELYYVVLTMNAACSFSLNYPLPSLQD